jgi:transcriptional regulator with XRE-family HTH domain
MLMLDEEELARRAGISVAVVRLAEAAMPSAEVTEATLDQIRRALEEAGIEFIENGVRHRPRRSRDRAQLFRDLRAIAERSAAQLAGQPVFSEADLYDENGLPR